MAREAGDRLAHCCLDDDRWSGAGEERDLKIAHFVGKTENFTSN
jgi:hypothetical protein